MSVCRGNLFIHGRNVAAAAATPSVLLLLDKRDF